MELGAIGADADVGFAWSGGGNGAGAGRGQGGYGVISNDRQILQHRQWGPRSPLLLTTRAREALMMAGAGGATRARGWRATAIRFQQLR